MAERWIPPKPKSRPEGASLWQRLRLARRDFFSSQPDRLYRAWMAQQNAILYQSFLINDPAVIRTILEETPEEFPKSGIIGDTLKPLLGRSVFVTNGTEWSRQRRLIDPAFEGGRLREVFPAMQAAGEAAIDRLSQTTNPVEVEAQTAHLTADVIFRTLFSIPITDSDATDVYEAFRDYQRTQPVLSPISLLRAPAWVPRFRNRAGDRAAATIRRLLGGMIARRAAQIDQGSAPDDLATKIMTATDPTDGSSFTQTEMADQVAIFFLAGHETSASALSWALYLLARDHEVQARVRTEAEAAFADGITFASLRAMPFTRDVFREVLRLYPPVPMMVREAARPTRFRDRSIARGALAILAPWYLHRHERLWQNPDAFDPDRWSRPETTEPARTAYLPFSKGPRVCTGAGFAMMEGVLLLAMLVKAFRFEGVDGEEPMPVTHLTLRSEGGIMLSVAKL